LSLPLLQLIEKTSIENRSIRMEVKLKQNILLMVCGALKNNDHGTAMGAKRFNFFLSFTV
jgi:hypothetical protein